MVAVHLLPQVIAGVLVNIVAGFLRHRVSNRLLITLSAVCYVNSLVSSMRCLKTAPIRLLSFQHYA